MPLYKELKKVMLIGSGPIVIGQAAEFDYAGTQACKVLKDLGLSVVLVNPNPATIMTDSVIADRIYIEPLNLDVLKRIIEAENPDGLISTIGGQMGLTLSMQLAKDGFLAQHNVRLLGASLETIDNAEDRLLFKQTMESIDQPIIPSDIVTDLPAAVKLAKKIGYPVIVRPAFTLGGAGGGIAKNEAELREIAKAGLDESPITQILVEKCISGWKEIEFEVMRDSGGNVIAVCSMENLDPVGVHTGDSIVVAPAVTLSNTEYQMLRTAALRIIQKLEVNGGCNVQFALHPESMEYAVIEVNPRVSRSSALASKATGYPIAKVAAQIAVGLHLDEIENAVTKKTTAFFEPTIDYIVVKFPKWPFDKFVGANRTLGTQMKATGEVMSIGTTFENALLKAVRGAEIKQETLNLSPLKSLSDKEIRELLSTVTDERIFVVYEALLRGITVDEIHAATMIDEWFLYKLLNIAALEKRLMGEKLTEELYVAAKKYGFTDRTIEAFSKQKIKKHLPAGYKMVDTCAAEFEATTPYFYSSYAGENEAAEFIKAKKSGKKTVIVFGSGPIRIGQGIEFDYTSVHCVWTLKELGYEVVMVNNNPETVSTDFDTSDRLYFEPLYPEDVLDILAVEKPFGAVVAFGGQTAINLTKTLKAHNIKILGTSADAIDAAEDREKFDAILNELKIERPQGKIVATKAEALSAASKLGYPVLVRPSYVLGGKNMIIAFSDADINEYMDIILASSEDNTILVDKYLSGTEVEVDAICDGKDILIPGIMEHIERAGVHSGDSIAVYPAWNLNGPVTARLVECTKKLAVRLGTKGLINIQYVIHNNDVYVIEANPRASRTIPYISKVTGLPIAKIATRAMLGEKLKDIGYGTGLYKQSILYAAKVPVFSFEKLKGVDSHLGPEMKSTGEVLGIGRTIEEALYKGLVAANYKIVSSGGVLVSMYKRDSREVISTVRELKSLGFEIYAPNETSKLLSAAGIENECIKGKRNEREEIFRLLDSGKINYVIATSEKGQLPDVETVMLRRKAVECHIACLSSIDTANAIVEVIKSGYSCKVIELFTIGDLPTERKKLSFIKMRASGNDYIYFDCFNQTVEHPESLSVTISSRRKGIGGDGIVLIMPSEKADIKMVMYNADGTLGEIAGNALRCVAKYAYDSGRVQKERFTVDTDAGIKKVSVFVRDGKAYSVSTEMGAPDFEASAVPVKIRSLEKVINEPYTVLKQKFNITCLSMGNPHCVIFVDDVDALNLEKYGPLLEKAPIFANRANISFARFIDKANYKVRFYERGIGETWACGTGACAVASAAIELGMSDMNSDVVVHMRGGNLVINRRADGLTMTGDAQKDFEGFIEV